MIYALLSQNILVAWDQDRNLFEYLYLSNPRISMRICLLQVISKFYINCKIYQ